MIGRRKEKGVAGLQLNRVDRGAVPPVTHTVSRAPTKRYFRVEIMALRLHGGSQVNLLCSVPVRTCVRTSLGRFAYITGLHP